MGQLGRMAPAGQGEAGPHLAPLHRRTPSLPSSRPHPAVLCLAGEWRPDTANDARRPGIYFIKQWPGGEAFLAHWLSWQEKNVGHDQDGFNVVARGQVFRGDAHMPLPFHDPAKHHRMFYLAHSNTTAISLLPGSMFANAYTYVNTRLHEVRLLACLLAWPGLLVWNGGFTCVVNPQPPWCGACVPCLYAISRGRKVMQREWLGGGPSASL